MKDDLFFAFLYGLLTYLIVVFILGGIGIVFPFMPHNSMLVIAAIFGGTVFFVSAARNA